MTPQSFVVFVLVVRTAHSQINALASVLEFANSPDSDSEHVTSQVLERPIEKLDWTEEEAALIEEFTQMLSSTPRDGQVTEETTFLRPTEMLETARSLLSTTNTAVVRGQNSITFPSDQSVAAKRLKTFADLLPRESLNPPKLEQATSFEDLLSPPVIYEESESGTRQTIDLEKKRKMIAEALERMKKKEVLLSGKIKFPPVRPEGGEDKFADYEDSSTWGPVTEEEAEEEEEYTTEYDETGQEMIKQIMEDHTENNFGLGILSVPNMMETTLLKLLNKSQKEEFSSSDISLNSNGDSERSSELNIVSSRDPLNKNIGELPQRENFELTAPRKQNPLLSLLEPVRQDYSDDIFSAPDYRQDPLLRLLQKNPKRYQDDFLQLPPKQQTQLLKIFMRAGPGVDIDQLVPPDYKQNPLLRLLVPQYTDHIDSLTPPRISQNTIMRALLKEPGKFANDFLILSDGDKEEILDLVDQANDATFNIELLIPSRSERLRILQSHSDDSREPSQELPASKRSNPLLEFLEGDKRDEREKEQLTVPLYRQDPLLRQLRVRPEKYREDFLALPARAQHGLLRKLREHGVPRWNIDRLTPPDFDQNPLIRMIQNKDNKFLPKENSIVMDLIKNPEDFTEDFSVLSNEAKEEVVEMIHKNDDGSFEMAILIPDKSERLKMMTKNPLLRFLEANKQDDQDKVNFVPPKYRQDPLLRQLRLRPEMYQSDFLELPRRKQDTLLKLLKNSGLESTLMERLLPPGSKQDPLLRALIGDNNDNIGNIKPPSYKQNPLVRLLRPDKTDKLDRDRLTLPQKEATFKQLLEQPQTLASEFDELSQEDQEKLVDMVEKSGKDTEKILNKLPPRKSERLTVVKDPLIVKNIPKYTQSDAFREIEGNKPPAKKQNDLNKDDEAEKDSLRLPVDPLLEEVMTNPGEYKNAFDKLPSNDQETLMKILSEESGSIVVEDFFEAETLKKNPDFSSDVEAQRLLSFYQWSKELLTRLNVQFWNEIKTVLGQVIREKLGDNFVPPGRFSELLDGDDLSFKIKIEAKVEKLKKMNSQSNRQTETKFDNLMHSVMAKAKKTNEKQIEMTEKVEMVDSLVDLFIKGNAMRAHKMNEERERTRDSSKEKRKEIFPPRRDVPRDSNTNLRPPKSEFKPKDYDFTIGNNKASFSQELLPRQRQNPLLRLLNPEGRDELDKNQLTPPLKADIIRDPEEFQGDFLQLPQHAQIDLIELLVEDSDSSNNVIKKLAPVTEQRNPLLRILNPNQNDKHDRKNLQPPSQKQDPLLRQLAENPRVYQNDFLELPQRKQEIIIEMVKTSDKDSEIDDIIPEGVERNPLKRLLQPTSRDESDKKHFLPPSYRQDPLLRQLKSQPEEYNEDFLELPMRIQTKVIDILEEKGADPRSLEKLTRGNRNPLLRVLEGDKNDQKDKQNLTPPRVRQDPLLRQLKTNLEQYREDILELPSRKQDSLLKILRKQGVEEEQIRNILPPGRRQNPLTRLLRPHFKDTIEKDQLAVPRYKQDPLLRQLIDKPEEFSEDFLSLPLAHQDGIIAVIEKTENKFFDTNKLVPRKIERNPLKRLLNPNDRDERDKANFKPPKYRQNPLLRQLANNPVNFKDDLLELPRQMRASLLKIIKDFGVRENALSQLKSIMSEDLPNLKELFLIKNDRDLERKILDSITEDPNGYARLLAKLFEHKSLFEFQHTRTDIVEMIEKDPKAVAAAFSELIINQRQQSSSFPEDSRPQINFTTFKTTGAESVTTVKTTRKPPRIKVLTQIIKKPKNGSVVKNADFSEDKVKKLKNSIRSKETKSTSKTVYKTKDGEIIPNNKIKFDEHNNDEIIFPDPKLKLVKEKKIFTPKVPHPYEDPPKEVEGQLLRYWNKDEKEKKKPELQGQELSLTEDFDIPRNILNNMLKLIEAGNLSKEEVIEHLINNGFLPVEVTEIGKLPISVGHSEQFGTNREGLRPNRKFREEVTSERLRELSTTQRIPFDEMKNIDISDPDFDFERIDPIVIRTELDTNMEDFGKHSSEKLEQPDKKITIFSTTEKNEVNTTTFLKVDSDEMEKIEAVMTMIRMFENGQIDEDELLTMMSQMGEGIIGDFNPITEFTMFGAEGDLPVQTSYFNMKRPIQTSQEKPPVEDESIVFQEEALEPIGVPRERPRSDPFTSFASLGAGPTEQSNLNGQNDLLLKSLEQSIKTFTSFGQTSHENHNTVGSKPRFVGDIPETSGVASPHTLYYDDFSDHIKLPDNFPTFDSFDLGHHEEVPGPGPVVHESYLPPSVTTNYVTPSPPTSHHSQVHYYPDVNQSPLDFNEMSHQAFSPGPAPTYGAPREPFAPPASLLSSLSAEYREMPPAEIQHQLPESRPASYVKSLPEYPPYGQYGEGYPSYSEPPPPGYTKHQHLPGPEYISSQVVHQSQPGYSSPLYLHHGPAGYGQDQPGPLYYSQYGQNYPSADWSEYGPRRGKDLVGDLPDHTTRRSFAYEDLPLPPLTGYREIDLTIEDIHKAFVKGDAMGPQGPPS